MTLSFPTWSPSLLSYRLLPPWWTWAPKRRNTAWSRISAAEARARAARPGSRCAGWPAFGSWMCDCSSSDPHWTMGRHSLQGEGAREIYNVASWGICWMNFTAAKTEQQKKKRGDRGAATSEPREATMLKVKDIMRARQREWRRKKCKKERAVAG